RLASARRAVRGRGGDGARRKESAHPVTTASRARRAGERGDDARFARLGLREASDFVLHLPIRYEDRTRIVPIADVRDGQAAQVEGVVVRSEIVPRPRRVLRVELRDETASISLRFFHFYPSQTK